jgi:hypothetical protein
MTKIVACSACGEETAAPVCGSCGAELANELMMRRRRTLCAMPNITVSEARERFEQIAEALTAAAPGTRLRLA